MQIGILGAAAARFREGGQEKAQASTAFLESLQGAHAEEVWQDGRTALST